MFREPTKTVIDEADGDVYEIKRNPMRTLDEYQRDINWDEIDRSITSKFDENEVFNFTQDRVVSGINPWTIPHHWASKIGGDGR